MNKSGVLNLEEMAESIPNFVSILELLPKVGRVDLGLKPLSKRH